MVSKTRGRKASGSCASASYVKSHPSSALKVCNKRFTCKKVDGKTGKYCVAKKAASKKTRKTLKVSKTGAIASRTRAAKRNVSKKAKGQRESNAFAKELMKISPFRG